MLENPSALQPIITVPIMIGWSIYSVPCLIIDTTVQPFIALICMRGLTPMIQAKSWGVEKFSPAIAACPYPGCPNHLGGGWRSPSSSFSAGAAGENRGPEQIARNWGHKWKIVIGVLDGVVVILQPSDLTAQVTPEPSFWIWAHKYTAHSGWHGCANDGSRVLWQWFGITAGCHGADGGNTCSIQWDHSDALCILWMLVAACHGVVS